MALSTYYLHWNLLVNGDVFGKPGTDYEWDWDVTVTLYIGNPTLSGGDSGTIQSGTQAKSSTGGDPTIGNVGGNAAFTDLLAGIYTVLVNRLDGTGWHKLPNLTNVAVGAPEWTMNSFTGADDALSTDLDLEVNRTLLGDVSVMPIGNTVQVWYTDSAGSPPSLLVEGTHYTIVAASNKITLDDLTGVTSKGDSTFHTGDICYVYFNCWPGNHVS